jgi:hypothetical protein
MSDLGMKFQEFGSLERKLSKDKKFNATKFKSFRNLLNLTRGTPKCKYKIC